MSAEAGDDIAAPAPAAFDESNLTRSVLRLAWPVVIQQVSFTTVQLVETFLVGHLGEDALAGVGLASILYWVPLSGMSAIGIPFYTLLFAANACLQGSGDTRTPMLIMLAVNLINGILSWVLINGMGPMPEYGVRGAGLGFLGAALAGEFLVLAVLIRGTRGVRFQPSKALAVDSAETGRVLRVGIPSGAEQLQFMAAFLLYTRIIASLGTTALAAHQVALRIEGLS